MQPKLIAAGLLCSTLLASAALAQSPAVPAGNQQPLGATGQGTTNTDLITQRTSGVLRMSDLIGRNVVGPNDEDAGEIENVVLDHSGRVIAFIIETGETLGFGGREVAVPVHAVQINPIDTTATTGTIRGAGIPASTEEGQQVRNDNRISRVLALDRIRLTIPVDQLRSAPEFEDND